MEKKRVDREGEGEKILSENNEEVKMNRVRICIWSVGIVLSMVNCNWFRDWFRSSEAPPITLTFPEAFYRFNNETVWKPIGMDTLFWIGGGEITWMKIVVQTNKYHNQSVNFTIHRDTANETSYLPEILTPALTFDSVGICTLRLKSQANYLRGGDIFWIVAHVAGDSVISPLMRVYKLVEVEVRYQGDADEIYDVCVYAPSLWGDSLRVNRAFGRGFNILKMVKVNQELPVEIIEWDGNPENLDPLREYYDQHRNTSAEMWLCGIEAFYKIDTLIDTLMGDTIIDTIRIDTLMGATLVPGPPYFSFVAVGTIIEWLALNIENVETYRDWDICVGKTTIHELGHQRAGLSDEGHVLSEDDCVMSQGYLYTPSTDPLYLGEEIVERGDWHTHFCASCLEKLMKVMWK